MHEPILKSWESYYVIVGTSAAALTGLQFVVLTLITEAGLMRGTEDTLAAFGSPNVVHFCAALLVSALLSAPWPGLGAPAVALGLTGAFGLAYSVAVLGRARRQRDYKPVLEDWTWHAALPMLAYAALVSAGIQLRSAPELALQFAGGSTLLLVFIGIHNSWDTVTYVTLERARERRATAEAKAREQSAAISRQLSIESVAGREDSATPGRE